VDIAFYNRAVLPDLAYVFTANDIRFEKMENLRAKLKNCIDHTKFRVPGPVWFLKFQYRLYLGNGVKK